MIAEKYIERFHQRYVKTSNGCWEWTAGKNPKGYGQMNIGRGYPTGAYRISYLIHRGRVPDGLQIDHLCRNRSCVNPDHLEAVTQRVNLLRGDTRAAENARKTQCLRGHKYTDRNTYTYKGLRSCRECHRLREVSRRERNANSRI